MPELNEYTKTVWEDLPSEETPINAENLNKIENQIEAITNDVMASNLLTKIIYKGEVALLADLPSTNQKVGDYYIVVEKGVPYLWNGTEFKAQVVIPEVEVSAQSIGALISSADAKATPDVDDVFGYSDSEDVVNPNILKKLTWGNIRGSLATFFEGIFALVLHGHSISDVTGLQTALDLKVNNNGWNLINSTFTYASADSPTFVANTSVDLTSVISVGMKIKLTQTTVKYFIVTAITSTTITLYGGTDYILANTSITLPYFSSMKAPFGFPLNPDKWTVIYTNNANTLGTPTNNTWWNPSSISLTVPIGFWRVSYKVKSRVVGTIPAGQYLNVYATLSNTNNSETYQDLTLSSGMDIVTDGSYVLASGDYAQKELSFSTKTILYLLHKVNINGTIGNYCGFSGADVLTVIKAVCAYL